MSANQSQPRSGGACGERLRDSLLLRCFIDMSLDVAGADARTPPGSFLLSLSIDGESA